MNYPKPVKGYILRRRSLEKKSVGLHGSRFTTAPHELAGEQFLLEQLLTMGI